ncbi:hypothetical protein SUNI508_11007 [Seiridium unicorne]|uniref:Uncharacterized protein n=1 Tax=Seiridium unicorne TaxID=138068 RepID=A0ABR2UJC1_9PEZI
MARQAIRHNDAIYYFSDKIQNHLKVQRAFSSRETGRIVRALYLMEIMRRLLPVTMPLDGSLVYVTVWQHLPPWEESLVAYIAEHVLLLMMHPTAQTCPALTRPMDRVLYPLAIYTMEGVEGMLEKYGCANQWIHGWINIIQRVVFPRAIYTLTFNGAERLCGDGTRRLEAGRVQQIVKLFHENDSGPAELWLLKAIMDTHPWILDDDVKTAAKELCRCPPIFDATTLRDMVGESWLTVRDLATAAHDKVWLDIIPLLWGSHMEEL